MDELSKSMAYPCEICSLRLNDNSFLFARCCKWIDRECSGMKRVSQKILINWACRKWEGNTRISVEQAEQICNEVETVRKFTYPGDICVCVEV